MLAVDITLLSSHQINELTVNESGRPHLIQLILLEWNICHNIL